MKKILLILTTFFFHQTLFAQGAPHILNFDGQLINSSTTPPSPIVDPTTVTFEIWDGSPTAFCLLYRESRMISPNINGEFTTQIGPDAIGGTAYSNDGDIAWPDIFRNDGQMNRLSGTNCSADYTAAPNHSRRLRVIVAGVTLTPDYTIAPVPVASVAETLQGKRPGDFLLSEPSSGISGLRNSDLRINHGRQLQFGNTASTQFVSLRAPAALSADYILTLPNNMGSNGQVLTTNGSGDLSWSTPAGGAAVTTVFGRAGNVTALAGDYDAAQINFSPGGGVTSTNLQAALLEVNSYKLAYTGGTMTGVLDMGANHISNLATPIAPTDAANRSYVDSTVATFAPGGLSCTNNQVLRWNGGTMLWECHTPAPLPAATLQGQLLKVNSSLSPTWSSLIAGDNNASSPGLTFSSAIGTGVFSVSSSNLGFSTAGAERVRINSVGRVGINTQTPEGLLHINDNSSGIPLLSITGTSSSPLMELYHSGSGSIPKFAVTQNGVGINTSSPAAALHVIGDIISNNLNSTHISANSFSISNFFTITPSTLPGCSPGNANEVRLQASSRKICICNGISQWLETDGTTACTP